MNHLWNIFETSSKYLWTIFEISLNHLWNIFEPSLNIFESCPVQAFINQRQKGLGKVLLTKRRFLIINGMVRKGTAKNVNKTDQPFLEKINFLTFVKKRKYRSRNERSFLIFKTNRYLNFFLNGWNWPAVNETAMKK